MAGDIVQMYIDGKSLSDIKRDTGTPLSTARYHIRKAGVLRTKKDGIRLAGKQGEMSRGSNLCRKFPPEWRENISKARKKSADKTAKGTSVKPNGYVEYTRGPNKGRSVHVVKMEERIGRRILKDEIVHHIDGNRANNEISNLALMTRAAHTRLHRREQRISKGAEL